MYKHIEPNKNDRLLRIKEVVKRTGLSKSYIYQLRNENKFPPSVQLVPGGISVAWLETDITEWIQQRVEE